MSSHGWQLNITHQQKTGREERDIQVDRLQRVVPDEAVHVERVAEEAQSQESSELAERHQAEKANQGLTSGGGDRGTMGKVRLPVEMRLTIWRIFEHVFV